MKGVKQSGKMHYGEKPAKVATNYKTEGMLPDMNGDARKIGCYTKGGSGFMPATK